MCIGMCIVLFIELKFYLYINTLIQFIDSYYRHSNVSPRLLKLTESPHNLRFTTPFIISTSTKVP